MIIGTRDDSARCTGYQVSTARCPIMDTNGNKCLPGTISLTINDDTNVVSIVFSQEQAKALAKSLANITRK